LKTILHGDKDSSLHSSLPGEVLINKSLQRDKDSSLYSSLPGEVLINKSLQRDKDSSLYSSLPGEVLINKSLQRDKDSSLHFVPLRMTGVYGVTGEGSSGDPEATFIESGCSGSPLLPSCRPDSQCHPNAQRGIPLTFYRTIVRYFIRLFMTTISSSGNSIFYGKMIVARAWLVNPTSWKNIAVAPG
jgi:hypothetical protein